MTTHYIVQYPSSNLLVKAKEVDWRGDVDLKEIKNTINFMYDCMQIFGGIGLASTQIVMNDYRIITFIHNNSLQHLVNPVIEQQSDDYFRQGESCLSLPNLNVKVKRSHSIVVSGENMHGVSRTTLYNGLTARIIQHEIDHLNGILLLNYLSKRKVRKYKKWLLKNKSY